MVHGAPRSRTGELSSREVQESMGIVWRGKPLSFSRVFCAQGSSGLLVREHGQAACGKRSL